MACSAGRSFERDLPWRRGTPSIRSGAPSAFAPRVRCWYRRWAVRPRPIMPRSSCIPRSCASHPLGPASMSASSPKCSCPHCCQLAWLINVTLSTHAILDPPRHLEAELVLDPQSRGACRCVSGSSASLGQQGLRVHGVLDRGLAAANVSKPTVAWYKPGMFQKWRWQLLWFDLRGVPHPTVKLFGLLRCWPVRRSIRGLRRTATPSRRSGDFRRFSRLDPLHQEGGWFSTRNPQRGAVQTGSGSPFIS
jgi:hypothetical protein